MTPEESREILKLATAVGGISARIDGMEKARALAREEDKDWREGVQRDIDSIKAGLTEMPCMMDAKIDACRAGREVVTHDAVEDATRRHVLGGFFTDWRTWTAFALGVIATLLAIFK